LATLREQKVLVDPASEFVMESGNSTTRRLRRQNRFIFESANKSTKSCSLKVGLVANQPPKMLTRRLLRLGPSALGRFSLAAPALTRFGSLSVYRTDSSHPLSLIYGAETKA
jgi:hypothetical protein